jgi:hypothetical protein
MPSSSHVSRTGPQEFSFTFQAGAYRFERAPIGKVAEAVTELAARIAASRAAILQDRLDLGRMLCEVRARFGNKRGTWLRWLNANCLHRTTARRCMAQARFLGASGAICPTRIREALREAAPAVQRWICFRMNADNFRTEPEQFGSIWIRKSKGPFPEIHLDEVERLTDDQLLLLRSSELEVLAGVRELPRHLIHELMKQSSHSDAGRRQSDGVASGLLAHASSPISPLPVEPARHSAAVGVHSPAAVFSAGSLVAPGNERTDALAPGVEEEDFEGDDELVDDVGDEDGLDEFEASDDDVGLDEAIEDDEPVAVGASGAQLGLADLYAEIDRVSTLLGSVRAGLSSGALLPERVRAALDAAERELAGVLG